MLIKNRKGEIWKSINGYEGLYEVSNKGRVKALHRIWYSGIGHKIRKEKDEHLLKLQTICGYKIVSLVKNSKEKQYKVHRLVGSTFIENESNEPTINHINGFKNDNRIENLEWASHLRNLQHALDTGLRKPVRGEAHRWFGKKGDSCMHYGRRGSLSPVYGVKGIAHHSSKIILDTQTGIFYHGVHEAAQAKGHANTGTLRCRLNGGSKNNTGLIYV